MSELNTDLLDKVMDRIAEEAERPDGAWDQNMWIAPKATSHCGTTMCFAGWAVHLAGATIGEDRYGWPAFVREDGTQVEWIAGVAEEVLGLSSNQASELFWTVTGDVEEIRDIVEAIKVGDIY